jgi:hypothetical protein
MRKNLEFGQHFPPEADGIVSKSAVIQNGGQFISRKSTHPRKQFDSGKKFMMTRGS